MRWTTTASLALAWIACGAFANDGLPTGTEIAEKVNARDEGVQVTRKLTMEMIDKRGKSRVRETFGYRKYLGDEKRTVIFYLSPANIKDTAFLTYDYPEVDKDDDQWLYIPAARKVRRLSASERGDYFLGTDFSYEDIKKESKLSLEDYTFTALGEEAVDGRPCYILEAIPVDDATAKELGYGKVKTWVDKNVWMTIKSEFWDIRMNPLKTIHIQDIQEIDGIWTVMKIEASNTKTGHTTKFTFTDVDYDAAVGDDIFTTRALERGVNIR
jgi:hypothetical protein